MAQKVYAVNNDYVIEVFSQEGLKVPPGLPGHHHKFKKAVEKADSVEFELVNGRTTIIPRSQIISKQSLVDWLE